MAQIFSFDPKFNQILDQIEESTEILKRLHSGETEVDSLLLREDLTSLQYQLLWLLHSQSDDIKQNDVQKACCLGMLLYLTTIQDDLPSGAGICDMLIERLRIPVELIAARQAPPTDLLLWLEFLMYSIAGKTANRALALHSFIAFASNMGLRNKADVRLSLMSLFWVENVHGPFFEKIWDKVQELSKPLQKVNGFVER